jgi:hypothetical protein
MPEAIRQRRPRRGRRTDNTGRSGGSARFLKLEHWFLKTNAWQSLGPTCRALYVELAQRFNGSNNGEISMSVREAAHLLHIAKDTATKAFHELEETRFIKRAVCGSFNWKLRHATTWILTEHDLGDTFATKEFARWSPTSEPGPNPRPNCPNPGTLRLGLIPLCAQSVLGLGPWTQFCTVPRSQTAARI